MLKALLGWDNGYPRCQRFGDIYFSEDGVNESSYVFLGLNELEQKFSELKEDFTIAELGFGTGLNFFLSWKLFLEKAPKGKKLNFISIEKYPLSAEEFKAAWSLWPELKGLTSELGKKLPSPAPGFHRIELADSRISLTLIFLDVKEALSKIQHNKIDSWFLDGFSPQKNPEMWSEEVLESISSLSVTGSSLSTFSSAGFIKRSLEEKGWKVEKVKGYGKKRDSLKASFIGKTAEKLELLPWFSISNLKSANKTEALIIGAGLAGCWTAYNLAQKGLNVSLIDRHPEVAMAASGNLKGLAIPYLSLDNNIRHRFYLEAFDYSRTEIKQIIHNLEDKGVYQQLSPERLKSLEISFDKLGIPQEIAQVINSDTVSFPQAVSISPPELCKLLTERFKDKISVVSNREILSIEKQNFGWLVKDSQSLNLSTENLIVCNSYEALNFKALDWLPLTQVRGEIVLIEDKNFNKKHDKPVCGGTYLIPAGEDKYLIGASYDYVFLDPLPSEKIQCALFEKSQAEFGCFSESAKIIGSRVSYRASTYDRLPFVGPVPNLDFMLEQYADYKKGFKSKKYQNCNYLDGLYVNVGHGSRGLVSAPISAEIISSLICNQPLPVAKDVFHSLMPSRWPIRQLARGQSVERQRSYRADFAVKIGARVSRPAF